MIAIATHSEALTTMPATLAARWPGQVAHLGEREARDGRLGSGSRREQRAADRPHGEHRGGEP